MLFRLIDEPRRTGKTTRLRLYAHENVTSYDAICVLGHSDNSTRESLRYMENNLQISKEQRIYGSVDSLRGSINRKILILIDEPFLMDFDKQATILNMLDILKLRNEIEVYGIGTRARVLPFDKFVNSTGAPTWA